MKDNEDNIFFKKSNGPQKFLKTLQSAAIITHDDWTACVRYFATAVYFAACTFIYPVHRKVPRETERERRILVAAP